MNSLYDFGAIESFLNQSSMRVGTGDYYARQQNPRHVNSYSGTSLGVQIPMGYGQQYVVIRGGSGGYCGNMPQRIF
jgi:hypothetical protein